MEHLKAAKASYAPPQKMSGPCEHGHAACLKDSRWSLCAGLCVHRDREVEREREKKKKKCAIHAYIQ